ncbi:hypothetical protein [Polycladidibacter stylochi]|uniref:hypothetical protein n=1 Tax=Polycladidibacter stylochi TaxID=1807766 RepID=UPI001AD8F8EE|nr:hypothetical protein [Pseudovibrio stylochi]
MGDELAGYVAERAAFNHIKLVRRMGAPSSYRIKGHLTSTGSKANTTVFYVFDIYDNNGKRVHRIEGLEPAGGTATGDPWAGVSSDSLKRIATRSMASLRAWLHSS